jgi:hypothetical protein
MRLRIKIALLVGFLLATAAGFWNITDTAMAQRKTFSHTTPAHRTGKYADCASCHNLPTNNWATARPDKEPSFPDVRNFPSHASCFSCHTKDIYSAGGAFCGTCHIVPTMRARALLAFPIRSHARQFNIIFPHDKHQDLIAENTRRDDYAPAHFVKASFRFVDDKPKPTFYNCAICHTTAASAMPKFVARKLEGQKALADAITDTFARPVTAEFFKESPNSHASCFQCHYGFQNLPAAKKNCAGCHAPAMPYFEGKTVERYSLKFDHNRAGHVEKDCASCHVRITQNADVRTMKDADVPVAACKSCHATQEDEPSRKILLTEIESREAKPAFQCAYCHTSAIGRFEIPASHKSP